MRFLLLSLILGASGACSQIEPLPSASESCRRTHQLGTELFPHTVEWTVAADTTDQRLLDLWCETVGPAVVRRHPAARDTGRIVIDSIAIVSWNMHVGGADIERFVRDLRAGRFTHGVAVEYFALLLQEVYRADPAVPERVRIDVPARIVEDPPGSTRRQDIVETATRLGLSLLYVPSMRNGPPGSSTPGEDRGNAILATFALEDMRAIDLPYEVQRRVAAVAEIDVETSAGHDWDLALVSVHLDTRSRFRRLAASAGGARQRQAAALIEETEDEELIVVGGDFNTWAPNFFERAIPYLRSAFPDTPEPPPQHTFQGRGIRRKLDYLFFRLPDEWRATYVRIDAQYGSDHYPLLGWIHAPQ